MTHRRLQRAALVAAAAASLMASLAIAAPAPKCGTPVLNNLPGYTAGSAVTLTWTSPPMSSDGYIVEVADNAAFAASTSNGSVTGSPYTVTGLSESIHFFRVKAKTDSQGRCLASPFSNTVSTTQDATGPTVTGTFSRVPDSNGWYNAELSVAWSGTDLGSGVASCSPDSTYAGPGASDVTLGGSCIDNVGNSGTGSVVLDYDADIPSVTATPSREADSNGWYNHEFSVSFNGIDTLSGIDFCSPSAVFSGPDTDTGSLTGGCTDMAGNSNSASFSFKYDATGPATSIDLGFPLVVGAKGDTVWGSASDNLSGVAGTRVTFTDILGVETSVDAACVCEGTSSTWSASTAGLLPGLYVVVATSTDVAGNVGPASAPATYIIL